MRFILTLVSFVLFSSPAFAEWLGPYECKSIGETGYDFNDETEKWKPETFDTVKDFIIQARDPNEYLIDAGGGIFEVLTTNKVSGKVQTVCTGDFERGSLFCKGTWGTFYMHEASGNFVHSYRGFYHSDGYKGGLGPRLHMGTCTSN